MVKMLVLLAALAGVMVLSGCPAGDEGAVTEPGSGDTTTEETTEGEGL